MDILRTKMAEMFWAYRDETVSLADAISGILAIPELRVGLSDSKAVQAAIAEFEAKGMQSAKNILAWHMNDKLNA